MPKSVKMCSIILLCMMTQACLGTIVGTTADVAIEVVKIPFKVGAAVVDVVAGDGSKKESNDTGSKEGKD